MIICINGSKYYSWEEKDASEKFCIDKLNMIDFYMFKLIFTCESCAISFTK